MLVCSDEYLYTLPLPKGRLGKALVDINNVAYVLVEEPAASGPFSEVGLVALGRLILVTFLI